MLEPRAKMQMRVHYFSEEFCYEALPQTKINVNE